MVRYLYTGNNDPARNTTADKDFARTLDFKNIISSSCIQRQSQISKKTPIVISVFGYENKEKYPIYLSQKCCEKKHVDLLMIGEEGKRYYDLIKNFYAFMYDHLLHCGRKHFCQEYIILYKLSLQKNN